MSEHAEHMKRLEERLKRSVPPLAPANPARVAAACRRIAEAGAPPRQLAPISLMRRLARAAACLALAAGLASVLTRHYQPSRTTGEVNMPQVATFGDLADLMQNQKLAQALAGEAANLTDDLANLTEALNTSTLSILF